MRPPVIHRMYCMFSAWQKYQWDRSPQCCLTRPSPMQPFCCLASSNIMGCPLRVFHIAWFEYYWSVWSNIIGNTLWILSEGHTIQGGYYRGRSIIHPLYYWRRSRIQGMYYNSWWRNQLAIQLINIYSHSSYTSIASLLILVLFI